MQDKSYHSECFDEIGLNPAGACHNVDNTDDKKLNLTMEKWKE